MLGKIKHNLFTRLICIVLVLNLISCGTILYPERKGQTGGQLDPAIVVLDGLGLLLFFIPGVVAFAVDFANGTIYLPGGKRAELTPAELQDISNSASREEQLNHIGMVMQRRSDSLSIFDGRDLQIKELESAENISAVIDGKVRTLALY